MDMEFADDEFEVLDTIIRNKGGTQALKSTIRLGLLLLVDGKRLEERGKIFLEIYISAEQRRKKLSMFTAKKEA